MDVTQQRLAEYVVERADTKLSAETGDAVRLHLLDSVACAIGAHNSPPAAVAKALAVRTTNSGNASIWFADQKTSIEMAAFANGCMIRYLDFNDAGGGGHPSDTIAAIVAFGEAYDLSEYEVMKGIVIAYEVMRMVSPGLLTRERGWDQGIGVATGVAAACTGLLTSDTTTIGDAVALAIVPAIPLRQTRAGHLSMWKAAATPSAARHGVFAAELALAGMTGPTAPFEGADGLFHRVTGEFQVSPPGDKTAIELAYLKFRPCDYQAQTSLELVERVMGDFDVEEIDRISVEIYWFAFSEIGMEREKWRPATRETADHSLPFVIASTLRFGVLTPDHFTEERLRDPKTIALMDRIMITENKDFTALSPPRLRTRIRFELRNGKALEETTDFPPGHSTNPLSWDQVVEKLRSLSSGTIPEPEIESLVQAVASFGERAELSTFINTMTSEIHPNQVATIG